MSRGKLLIAFDDESSKFPTCQISMVVCWPTITATGRRASGSLGNGVSFLRSHRPIFTSSTRVGEGIEIRLGCQFIGSLVRALNKLPGRYCQVSSLYCWGALFQAQEFEVGTVLAWAHIQTS